MKLQNKFIKKYNNYIYKLIDEQLDLLKILYKSLDTDNNDKIKKLIEKEEKEYMELFNLIIK